MPRKLLLISSPLFSLDLPRCFHCLCRVIVKKTRSFRRTDPSIFLFSFFLFSFTKLNFPFESIKKFRAKRYNDIKFGRSLFEEKIIREIRGEFSDPSLKSAQKLGIFGRWSRRLFLLGRIIFSYDEAGRGNNTLRCDQWGEGRGRRAESASASPR